MQIQLIIILAGIILFLYHYRYLYLNDNKNISYVIRTLVRQAARWSTAAEQDNDPLIAVLHANYGAGYLWALKDIATAEEIEMVTRMNSFKEFELNIVKIQDKVTKRAMNVCPEFRPKSIMVKYSH